MVININPNRINTTSGSKIAERKRQQEGHADSYVAPQRAHVNFIPAAESLRTLIAGAVVALRRGVTWDRGTILNLLV